MSEIERSRARLIAYYGLPMLFCLAVHWLGLKIWFSNDDFAWLGLRQLLHSPSDLISILFSPQAEGTVRTLSERLFFLVFSSVFGLESPPFRVWVFLTQFASIVLLMQITRRITGSAAAGFVAALLWSANAGLAVAISWSSAYNEIAAALFILLALRLFLAYIDTGKTRYWIWQWVVFLLGFGVLELNLVYPALAAGYALCCARKYLRRTLYLFIPSILFVAVHLAFIPKSTDAHYQFYFDRSLFATLWRYWAFAAGALRDSPEDWRPLWLGMALAILIAVGFAIFVYRKARSGEWRPLLLAAWFLIVMSPVLPLKNHFTEYYLTVPAIGLAMLAAWAIISFKHPLARSAAAALACLYLVVSITDNRMAEKYHYNRARRLKYLITGLEAQPKVRGGEVAMFTGIDNDLFWAGFCDGPFRLIGIPQVYLAPGAESAIERHPEWGCDVSRFTISADDAVLMLRKNKAGVFTLEGRHVRDVTQTYREAAWADFVKRHPGFVDVADPAYQSRLGPTWYPAEGDYRWMPKSATVQLHGPARDGQILEASGFCPAALLAAGPLGVTFRVAGDTIGTAALTQPNQLFSLDFPLPAKTVGQDTMQLEIEVSRTTKVPGDPRVLGLVFTTFTIK